MIDVNLESVSSVEEADAVAYAEAVLKKGAARGWMDKYRYKVFTAMGKTGIVFVDGGMNRSMTQTMILTYAAVLAGAMLVILAVIVILSKRAMAPIAKSYEKQKQFITDLLR